MENTICPYCHITVPDIQVRVLHIQEHNARHEKDNLDIETEILRDVHNGRQMRQTQEQMISASPMASRTPIIRTRTIEEDEVPF